MVCCHIVYSSELSPDIENTILIDRQSSNGVVYTTSIIKKGAPCSAVPFRDRSCRYITRCGKVSSSIKNIGIVYDERSNIIPIHICNPIS